MQTITNFQHYESLANVVTELVSATNHICFYDSATAIIKAWQLSDLFELILPHASIAALNVNPYEFPDDDILVTLDSDRGLWAESAYGRDGVPVAHDTSFIWVFEDCSARATQNISCDIAIIFSLGGGCDTN